MVIAELFLDIIATDFKDLIFGVRFTYKGYFTTASSHHIQTTQTWYCGTIIEGVYPVLLRGCDKPVVDKEITGTVDGCVKYKDNSCISN